MAQTGEQKQASAKPPAAETVGTTSAGGGQRPSFFSRLLTPPPRGNAGSQKAGTATQQSPLGKRFLGLMILLLIIEFVTIGLQYIDIKVFNGALERPWFHTKAFIIGGINNTYFAITLIVIGVAYFLLLRYNLLPRDLFNPTPRSAAATGASRQAGRAAPDGLGNERRSRAARRHNASTFTSRQTATTRRTTSAKASHTPAPPPTPSAHDEEYYRVKAALRQQRRRDAKR
jgi:hypothetical protein